MRAVTSAAPTARRRAAAMTVWVVAAAPTAPLSAVVLILPARARVGTPRLHVVPATAEAVALESGGPQAADRRRARRGVVVVTPAPTIALRAQAAGTALRLPGGKRQK
jgi:hypothetical protein